MPDASTASARNAPVVDVVNLFYTGTAEHDAYEAVARRFESIRANVGEYPPIIAASIQRIIRDEEDPEANWNGW